MLKKYLSIAAFAMAGGITMAQAPEAIQITEGEIWLRTGGVNVLGMSANGRYMVGACVNWEGFIFDCETGKLTVTGDIDGSTTSEEGANQLWGATDNGVAYGWDGLGGISLGIDGSYDLFAPADSQYIYISPKAVTPDGRTVVGYVNQSFQISLPCYWEGGEIHLLEYSTSEDAGFKINGGCEAVAVSDDGSIIAGYLKNRGGTYPLVYWKRQEDGTYKYIPAFEGRYEDPYDVDGKLKEYYTTRLPKLFSPLSRGMTNASMTHDGKTIVVYLEKVIDKPDGSSAIGPMEVGLYDIATGDVTTIPYDRNNLLYSNDLITINGISNNGYIVGFSGDMGASVPFILAPGHYDNALTPTEMFPGVDLLEIYEDEHVGGGVYMLTCISADGSRIGGFLDTLTEVEGVNTYMYAGFYINTGIEESGVETVVQNVSEEAPEYYDLQGRKIVHPTRGIYIRRCGNTAEKIVF